jgi:hypothetical protein
MTRTWELLSSTNSPPRRVVMPCPLRQKDHLTVHEHPKQTMEQAIKLSSGRKKLIEVRTVYGEATNV